MQIIVTGAAGRMGISNIQSIHDDKDCKLAGAVEYPESPAIGRDAGLLSGVDEAGVKVTGDIRKCPRNADVIIDFSSPAALKNHVAFALETKTALVVGTTGIEDFSLLEKASGEIPVIWAPNYSVGVNLLAKLVRISAEVLNEGFDVEIIEAHHRMKKDAPSGTALKLLNVVKDVYKTENVIYGREGMVGARPAREIAVHAVRGGDIVGDHTVLFAGLGERIELTHKASSRKTFSKGAIRAAKYIVKSGPGFYTMEDVLEL